MKKCLNWDLRVYAACPNCGDVSTYSELINGIKPKENCIIKCSNCKINFILTEPYPRKDKKGRVKTVIRQLKNRCVTINGFLIISDESLTEVMRPLRNCGPKTIEEVLKIREEFKKIYNLLQG